jgi:hypothetical protein
MAVIFSGLVAARADDLPVVYHGPTSPEAEFAAPYAIRVLPGGAEVEISGSFSQAVVPDFVAALAQAPQVRTVRLESPGGYVQPAIAVEKIIRAHGLDTYVRRLCTSACTLAFLGGHQRFLAPDARLGFHQAQARDVPPEQVDETMRRAYGGSGVPADFIDHVLRTPPRAMWFPSRNELGDAGITTGAPPPELAASDAAPFPEWAETIKDLRWASDDTLGQFATAMSNLLEQLQAASPEVCWGYAHNVPADLERHVRRETLETLAAALRRVRDDVREAPSVGIGAAEKSQVLAALFRSLPAGVAGPAVAALRADGDHAGFCPALRTVLDAALALSAADRGPALRALLSGGNPLSTERGLAREAQSPAGRASND